MTTIIPIGGNQERIRRLRDDKMAIEAATAVTRTMTIALPPHLQPIASILHAQPPEAQEACQFSLATAMQKAGKFELLSVAEFDGRWHYTFRGAGEVFSVVRPEKYCG